MHPNFQDQSSVVHTFLAALSSNSKVCLKITTIKQIDFKIAAAQGILNDHCGHWFDILR